MFTVSTWQIYHMYELNRSAWEWSDIITSLALIFQLTMWWNLKKFNEFEGYKMMPTENKRGSKVFAFLHYDSNETRTSGSVESLENSTSSSGLSRSGSIRISDSPLHRGSNLGSPAFRRKKRKTKRLETWLKNRLSVWVYCRHHEK